jgi:SAM-dependent methyltransferase
MDPKDRDRINRRYDERLDLYGADIRALASGTEERRRIRFDVLRDVGLFSGCSVLDLGCGFGDFRTYLAELDIAVDYTGYDINPRLITIAREKHPGMRLEVRDIQTETFPEFDFIVSTGSFNVPLTGQDNYEFIADLLAICFAHARRGVAIDFMSSYVDFRTREAFHYEPERLFALAKKITKRVCLRHDYPLFEFCLYLYPDFQGWAPPGQATQERAAPR